MRVARVLVPIALMVLLTACAAGPNPEVGAAGAADPPGFWLGLWHGIIAPITFIVSLFTDDVSIYEVQNSGNWYDFGFMFGLSISLGGSSAGGGRASRRR